MAGSETKSHSLLASVLLLEDAGALESNRQSSEPLKQRGKYHITPTRGKKFIERSLTSKNDHRFEK